MIFKIILIILLVVSSIYVAVETFKDYRKGVSTLKYFGMAGLAMVLSFTLAVLVWLST